MISYKVYYVNLKSIDNPLNYVLLKIGFVAQRFEMQSAPNWAKFKA